MTVYVYCHLPSRKAWPQRERIDVPVELVGKMIFLFDCPLEWIPQTQEQFEKACEWNGVLCGATFVWKSELVSFYQ